MSSESEKPEKPKAEGRVEIPSEVKVQRVGTSVDPESFRNKGYTGGMPATEMPPPPTNIPSVSLAPKPAESSGGNSGGNDSGGNQADSRQA